MTLRNQLTSSRKNRNTSDVECLDAYEDADEGFIEGDIVDGKVLSTFSFGMNSTCQHNEAPVHEQPVQKNSGTSEFIQAQTYMPAPRCITPPVNGEQYTVKRSYSMRPSTVRKLNELKAEHPDVNVLFNTIVDMSISHYYKYIFSEGGQFSLQEEKKITS